MTTPFISFKQTTAVYNVEQDQLFEKLLEKLNANRHLILAAGQGRGIEEYGNCVYRSQSSG